MKKYNVNIDRPKPSSEEILSRRDFDGLMKQYKAAPGKVVHKPFYKSGWFLGSLATAAAVAGAIVVYVSKSDVAPENKSTAPIVVVPKNNVIDSANNNASANAVAVLTKMHISPPFANLNVAFSNYKINSLHGGTITHSSGSKITFPANAFVDAGGNPVKGNVEIKYREFRDQVDLFLSGIPLQYDSAGVRHPFQSAGMMEIGAFVDGKVVYLNRDKQVKVEFASNDNSTDYNLYKFDTIAGNWDCLGKDNVVVKPAASDSAEIVADAMKGPGRMCAYVADMQKPLEPNKPVKADKHKNRFVVAVDPKEFPGMNDYQNVLFEVDESKTKFDKNYYNITWESIVAKKGVDGKRDMLTLKHGSQIVTLDVYPVLDGTKYDDAMKAYDEKMADYKVALDKYNQMLEQRKVAAQGVMVNGNRVFDRGDGTVIKEVDGGFMYYTKAQKKDESKAEEVMRVFTVSSFGVYNMDEIAQLPVGGKITMAVNDIGAALFTGFATMYHVDREKNSLFTYHNANPLNEFQFNPASSNLIWAVKDGALYYADNDQFKKLPTQGTATIELKKFAGNFKSPEEMKKFFKIGK